MARILVTGANGFVGQHLVKALKATHHSTFGATRELGDVTNKLTWESFPVVDVVIHLAARSFVPDSWGDISGFINANLLGTVEALNYCKSSNSKLIYLSSYLYGDPQFLPIPETADLSVNNPYALTKRLAEETCQFYSDSFGIPVTILRPFNVYGLGQSQQFLIPSLITQVTHNDRIDVKDLEPKRDYIYIDDLISSIIKSIDFDDQFNIFNVGSGISHSVGELIDMIQSHARTNLPVFSQSERRKNEILDTIADISRAENLLGWTPKWPLSDGIKSMLDNRPTD